MKNISNFFTKKHILQVLFFIAALALIIYFFPQERRFNYNYEVGKLWKYDRLSAPYNFYVYKSDSTFNREVATLKKNFKHIFNRDNQIGENLIHSFDQKVNNYIDSTNNTEKITTNFIGVINAPHGEKRENEGLRKILKSELQNAYKNGIVDTTTLNHLKRNSTREIRIIKGDNTYDLLSVDQLTTPNEVYSELLNLANGKSVETLTQNLHREDIIPNIILNDTLTANAEKTELHCSKIYKEVATGEHIIDQNQKITYDTYLTLESLKQEALKSEVNVNPTYSLVGKIIVIGCLLAFLYLFLALFRPQTFNSERTLGFIIMLVASISVIAFIVSQSRIDGIYMVPFAIIPIILVTFFDSRTALFTHLIIILICAFTTPFFALEFIFLQFITGMTAINSLNDLSRRSQLMRSALLVCFTYSFTYIGYILFTEGSLIGLDTTRLIYFVVNGILLLFAYLLIYIFEKLFKFTSTVTLVELSDVNNPILRQLSEECPGTFQHSLQMSNLASEAARRIGAKSQLVRTGALYHDIGKLKNPAFFTENQAGVNPHASLSFEQSAQIIISHVSDGLRIADKLLLPQVIKDFISTHHGRGKAKYFYNSYCNQFPNQPVDEEKFTYPGPNPFTKEHGILMMADSVEAASRSLKEYTDESISTLVNRLIDSQIADGLLRDTPLSFKDIEIIKATFIEKLKTIYHTRISYPELKKKPEENPNNTPEKEEKEDSTEALK